MTPAARLALVRHGEAGPPGPDGERALTARGRDETARLAEWCVSQGLAPAEIRHSGILRAAQTAEILAARLAPPRGVRAVRHLAPESDPSVAFDEVAHEEGTLLVVTHMPLVGDLAALLAQRQGALPFATAGIAVFERGDGAWSLVASRGTT